MVHFLLDFADPYFLTYTFLYQLGLMDDSGNVREDLKLPSGHDEAEALARQIQSQFDEGKELILTVLKSMGEEQVNASKEAPKQD